MKSLVKTSLVILLAVVAFPVVSAVSAPLVVVRDGKPAATIVLAKDASRPEGFAASQLRYWVKVVTGAELPVADQPEKGVNLFVGNAFAKGKFDKDVEALAGADGFAVRRLGDDLYVFGADPRAAVNGVYDLLEKNTDLFWPRPEVGLDRVYTPLKDLSLAVTDYVEKPAFAYRGWGFTGGGGWEYHHLETEFFLIRNKINRLQGENSPHKLWGMCRLGGAGHNLHWFLPEADYFARRPDFFCLIDGKRVYPSYHANLCFTNEEMAREFAKNAVKIIADSLDCHSFGIGVEDSDATCNCPRCVAPLKLPDGAVVEPTDPAFRSTQYYLFLNRVAAEIKKTYPKLKIHTLAYMFATKPPKLDLEDNVEIIYCVIGKNSKQNVFGSSNAETWKDLQEWNCRVKSLGVYEYYGCGSRYPRPLGEVAAADLKAWSKMRVNSIYSEMSADAQVASGFGAGKCWDVSAMEYYVLNRLFWNPGLDVNQLRERYLNRSFREAAPAVKKFYDIVRDTWYADGASSFWSEDPVKATGYYLLKDEKTENACRDALAEAVRTAVHPVSRKLAERLRDRFEEYAAAAKKRMVRGAALAIPFVADPSFGSVDGPAWSKALEVTEFANMFKPDVKAKSPVSVRVAHDADDLHLKIQCEGVKFPVKKTGRIWVREHFEIFIQTDRGNADIPYYHLAFDTDGEKYNGIGYGLKWNPEWKLAIRKRGTGYDALVTIPLKQINCGGKEMRLHFYRYDQTAGEHASLRGAPVHDAAAFVKATLEAGK